MFGGSAGEGDAERGVTLTLFAETRRDFFGFSAEFQYFLLCRTAEAWSAPNRAGAEHPFELRSKEQTDAETTLPGLSVKKLPSGVHSGSVDLAMAL